MAKSTSKRKQEKYSAHPAKAVANKIRKMKKHLMKHPGDTQTAKAVEGK